MDEKELRGLLAERLHLELQLFKCNVLRQTKEKIYQDSYRIEGFVNAYEILMEDIGDMDKDTVCTLLYQEDSILENLYNRWLTRKDCVYDVLRAYVESGLADIRHMNHPAIRKEREDGTESDQAA